MIKNFANFAIDYIFVLANIEIRTDFF
jgi:hypothetical protein